MELGATMELRDGRGGQLEVGDTPFERDTHDSEIVRILYVLHLYLLSYIVLL